MNSSAIRNKQLDIAGQGLIPVVLLLLYLGKIVTESIQAIGLLYLILGGWQFLSAMIHLGVKRTYWSSMRRLYYWLLLATIVLPFATLSMDTGGLISIGLIILGWTAIMAIFYFTIGMLELRKWKEWESEALRNAFNEESNESN